MKLNRLVALVVALCLMLGCTAIAEQFPLVDEPTTLHIMAQVGSYYPDQKLDNVHGLQKYEEMSGVHIEWDNVSNSVFGDTLAARIADSGTKLPDIILRGKIGNDKLASWGEQGIIVDLRPYLEENAPNFWKLFNEESTISGAIVGANGEIWGLPQVILGAEMRTPTKLWLNKNAMEAIGMDDPKTLDDYVKVMTAIRDSDWNGNGENDEIPLSGAISTAAQVFVTETLGISNNSAGTRSDWYEGEDGSMEYLMTSDLYKTYLERMHYLYAEKLLDNEIYTQSSTQFLAKGANMQIGACRTDAPFVLAGTDPEKYEQYVAFGPIAPEGGEPRQYFNEMYGANLYVTKANQYREVTARLLDYLYTEEWAQIIRGPQLGSEIKGDWDGKGGWYYIDDTQTKYAFEVPEEYSGVYYWRIGAVAPMALRGGLGYSETWMNEVMSDTDTHLRAIYADTWQYTVPCFPQEYSLTQEEADELALISTELKTYVDQMEVKFVVGEVDIDEGWDEFQAHLKSIGVEDYIRINQGAYERYLEIANNLE